MLLHALNVKLRSPRITKSIPNVAMIVGDVVDNMAHVIVDDCDILVMLFCVFWGEKRRGKRNVSALFLVFGRRHLFVGLQVSRGLESSEGIKFCMFFWGFREIIETVIIYSFMFAFA